MNILAIETSCDETAVSILDAQGDFGNATFTILGDVLFSQASMHAEFGGVYPNLAKREHTKNLVPLLEKVLEQSFKNQKSKTKDQRDKLPSEIEKILEREPELLKKISAFILTIEKPDIDAIAVTEGPGLEPALWVGINFARALGHMWNIPVIPVNHMEGHIFSSLLMKQGKGLSISDFQFPLLALLISGGHTELVLTKEWLSYELIGQTRDDAVGEAFDKIARMMELPYPGGPEISKLAEEARGQELKRKSVTLPRPMIRSGDCDFSFSGLKTAVLYKLRNYDLTSKVKKEFAREFEDAVVEILFAKSEKAIEQHGVKTLILGGGVSANTHIRRVFTEEIEKKHPHVALFIPPRELTTDNAIMIGIAGYFRFMNKKTTHEPSAQGNLKLAT